MHTTIYRYLGATVLQSRKVRAQNDSRLTDRNPIDYHSTSVGYSANGGDRMIEGVDVLLADFSNIHQYISTQAAQEHPLSRLVVTHVKLREYLHLKRIRNCFDECARELM